MASSTDVVGTSPGRRRFFDYPRARVKGFRRWLPSWRVLVGTFLAGCALVAGLVIAAYNTTAVPDSAAAGTGFEASKVYFADGTEMGSIGDTERTIVSYDDLPDYVGNAVVASEDSTFWSNSGVDPKGFARAMFTNVKLKLSGSTAKMQGGSTLTQQYAERYYMKGDAGATTDISGKFREAILAIKITKSQEKTEILGNYLNTIYFGRRANGIEAASQAYFGIPAAEMSISQAAMLAGIIPKPNGWNPTGDNSYAEGRWERVMKRMLDQGYITKAEFDEAELPETIPYEQENTYGGTDGYLMKLVEKELAATGRFGEDGSNLFIGGYQIHTTIDRSMQKQAVKTVKGLPKDADKGVHPSLVSLDPETSELKALYGGADAVENAYNSATQGSAQGGSTFKPFTLIAALESGKSLTDRYNGNNDQLIQGWDTDPTKRVTNFGFESFGDIDLVQATAHSVNTVYAALNVEIGPEKTADVAKRLGITTKVGTNAANVLGTDHVTAVELANAYATIDNGGEYIPWHIVSSVDKRGELFFKTPISPKRVVDRDVIDAATYAMTHVISEPGGSGYKAQALGRPVAGKTGTSNGNKAAWFAAFVPQLTTVVGMYQSGKDNEEEPIAPFGEWKAQGLTMTGGSWPASAWTEYMTAVLKDVPVEDFAEYTPPRATWSPPPTATASPSEEPTDEATEKPKDEYVQVPGGLEGQPAASAEQILRSVGLVPTQTVEYSDQPKGVVLRVQASGKVKKGEQVNLVVSNGPDPAEVIPPPTTDPGDQGGGDDGGGDQGGGDDGGGDQGGGGDDGGGDQGGGETPTPTPTPTSTATTKP